jgi:very-short-patch-repair endonuclease
MKVKSTPIARALRRNDTDAERKLWNAIRDRRLGGWKFKRQVPLDRYVVDFLCTDAKLIAEVDGSQHEAERRFDDAIRTRALETDGYFVVRFLNTDVLMNLDGVLETILEQLELR